jgi:putative ABC transport system permease protein
MFQNYFNIAWRNLLKNKVYSAIHIIGLAISVAFCLLLYWYMMYELSFDAFHAKKDRIYRLETTNFFDFRSEEEKAKAARASRGMWAWAAGDQTNYQVTMPALLGEEMPRQFPEIKRVVRLRPEGDEMVVQYGNQQFLETNLRAVEPNFFTVFSFPLMQGNPQTVLQDPSSVVITAEVSKKYFGRENPIGKTLIFKNAEGKENSYIVSGVARQAPANSSLQFNFLISATGTHHFKEDLAQGTNRSNYLTFIELHEHVDAKALQRKMQTFGKIFFKPTLDLHEKLGKENPTAPHVSAKHFSFHLRPLAECHYNPSGIAWSNLWEHFTDLRKMYQLGSLIALVLFIACVNYILLTLTNTAARSKEVGIRKINGARRGQVILQFFIETQVMVTLATLVGFGIAQFMLPFFNQLVISEIATQVFHLQQLVKLIAASVLLSLLAGFYPALVIGGFSPSLILRKIQFIRLPLGLSRGFVVIQYALCSGLIVCSLIMYRQFAFMNQKELGFDKEQILVVRNPLLFSAENRLLKERLAKEVAALPAVRNFSATNYTMGEGFNRNGINFGDRQHWTAEFYVDPSFFDLVEIPFVSGRNFSPQIASDSIERKLVINESFYKLLQSHADHSQAQQVLARTIGVVKDFQFDGFQQKILPAQFLLPRGFAPYFWFKLHTGNHFSIIEQLEKSWKIATNGLPFQYTFLDEDLQQTFQSELRWMKIVRIATIFAVFIACLGLFGLAGVAALNRTKEIGIRKVLGASVQQIITLLSKEFVQLALVATLLAFPIAWYLMQQWLEDFAYRITIQWWMFALAGMVAVAIALLTVSFQAVRAAVANPVHSLRSE